MLQQFLPILVLIPILGFIGCILSPKKWEHVIFSVAFGALLAELGVFWLLVFKWLAGGHDPILTGAGALYHSEHYSFALDLYFDVISAVFLGVATLMTALVLVFSKFYMHREPGFKRFYSTILLFFTGLVSIILAGNFEVLFLGWECIGISSILLIAFYRDRFLPARNALKVFSIYRLADVFLLSAIWYAHHLFQTNIDFSDFSQVVAQHGNNLVILSTLLLVAAMIKSAQFPFSYWLPRAMEGPTTSSAIIYGALSVHMGLFLLLRTFPLWEGSFWFRLAIAVVGLATAFIASSITRVQSSAKTQIAYASITQIGIMFVELAAGLHWLVLVHFVSNAFLRTYQLLISPSIVSYLVHDQFLNFKTPPQKIKNTLFGKARATLYILGIKEWSMNTIASDYLWRPFKFIGRGFWFLDCTSVQLAVTAVFVAIVTWVAATAVSVDTTLAISATAAVVSLIVYIRAFTTKDTASVAWNLLSLGHLYGILFLALASDVDGKWRYVSVYGAGVVAAFIVGHVCLQYLRKNGEANALQDYQGSIYVYPKLGQLFFIVALFFMAFPISPSFLAQDVLFNSVPEGYIFLMVCFCLSYLMVGVSTMRLYTKVFFGPHQSSAHEKSFKSS